MQTLVMALVFGLAGLLLGALLVEARGRRRGDRRLKDLEERTSTLQRELDDLAERQRATGEILGSMEDGVLVVDERGVVQEANPAAARLLEVPAQRLIRLPLVQSARSFPALDLLDKALAQGPLQDLVELAGGRLLAVQAIPLEEGGSQGRRLLFLLRDETSRLRTERMRRDFVANVSHELKTPLARMSLLTSTLRHAVDESPEETEGLLSRLSAEVSRLDSLVSDLLVLSEVEERSPGKDLDGMSPDLPGTETVDLSELVTTAASLLRPLFEQAGITLVLRLEPALVRGDAVYLETVVRNLLDNALRYSEQGGTVQTEVYPRDDLAVLSVNDDGRGIPRDAQERIFERFFRVDPARSRDTGGTGLGLSIVRHVVEQHGGRVEVQSALGVGSTFTVTLPLAAP